MKAGELVEGRYRIVKILGEGGMGTVFLAEHVLIKRRVALKILHTELATDADVVERFMNEARAAGTLGHPNIVESTDMGFTQEHVPYIVFEYLEGTLLTDEIYRVSGLPVRRTVRIAQQIASALHAAHNADIVHRDLKSDNIFLTDKDDALDHVKVLDFGISRFLDREDEQTRRGMVMGTPEFMAPEQITDPQSVDRRADIYALGVIMYEMLAARRPFSNDEDPRALLHRIVHEEAPPLSRPEVPHALVELISNKLLAKSPDDRYQTMIDVEAALEAFTTQGDAPRRRSRPLAAVTAEDLARRSDLIPRPVHGADTPWPAPQLGMTPAASMIGLQTPPPAAKRSAMTYGIAGMGVLVGALGLMMGLKGGSSESPEATSTPPAATQQQQDAKDSKVRLIVQATAPDARVVFRRRSAAAPLTMQLAPSDIVEIVEVSAPGHKTLRYWITVDRATNLNARLIPGDGLAEATEEETLIALGELAAPVPVAAVAPAAPTRPAAATMTKPVDAPRQLTVADVATPDATQKKRVIGKAAVEASVVMEETKAQVGPSPEIATPSLGESAPQAEAKLEQPEKVEPEKAEPEKAEPAKVEPEKAVEAKPVVTEKPKAGIDAAMLNSVVAANRPTVLKCFADGKKANRNLEGKLTLQLQVDAKGVVKQVAVHSTITGAALVSGCLVKAAYAWRFPATGVASSVAYPFVINYSR